MPALPHTASCLLSLVCQASAPLFLTFSILSYPQLFRTRFLLPRTLPYSISTHPALHCLHLASSFPFTLSLIRKALPDSHRQEECLLCAPRGPCCAPFHTQQALSLAACPPH